MADVNDGWIVLTETDRDAQITLESQFQRDLERISLEVVPPRELLNQHTLVIKKLDLSVFYYKEEEIIGEIEDNVPEARDQVEGIYIMKNHSIIKVKFKKLSIAQKIKNEGLRMYGCNYRIIENEKANIVKQCMRCYDYSHTKFDCNKLQLCSECSSTEHTYDKCNSTFKKCTQCQGNHRTFAASCPIRKAALEKKEEKETRINEEREHSSYANILKFNAKKTTEATKNIVKKTIEEKARETNENIIRINEDMKQAIMDEVRQEMDKTREINDNIIKHNERVNKAILDEVKRELREVKNEFQQIKNDMKEQSNTTKIYLSNETQSFVTVGYLYAHFKNLVTPGTFLDELNRFMEKNGYPKIEHIPTEVPAMEVFGIIPSNSSSHTNNASPQSSQTIQMETDKTQKRKINEEQSPIQELSTPQQLRKMRSVRAKTHAPGAVTPRKLKLGHTRITNYSEEVIEEGSEYTGDESDREIQQKKTKKNTKKQTKDIEKEKNSDRKEEEELRDLEIASDFSWEDFENYDIDFYNTVGFSPTGNDRSFSTGLTISPLPLNQIATPAPLKPLQLDLDVPYLMTPTNPITSTIKTSKNKQEEIKESKQKEIDKKLEDEEYTKKKREEEKSFLEKNERKIQWNTTEIIIPPSEKDFLSEKESSEEEEEEKIERNVWIYCQETHRERVYEAHCTALHTGDEEEWQSLIDEGKIKLVYTQKEDIKKSTCDPEVVIGFNYSDEEQWKKLMFALTQHQTFK